VTAASLPARGRPPQAAVLRAGLDREAADAVARLILGGGSAVSEASVNKPLASGRDGGDDQDR
jgi:hypothetical protein